MSEINWKDFCAEEDGRFKFAEPWIKDGWKCATDGRIAVRMRTAEADTETNGTPPSFDSILPSLEGDRKPWPLNPEITVEKYTCQSCICGKVECDNCGQHTLECVECEGTGKCERHTVMIGCVKLNNDYAKAIAKLRHVCFIDTDPRKPMRFWFDDGNGGWGEGAVMGINPG